VGRTLQMQMMIRLFSSPNMVKSLFLLSTELCTRKAQILVLGRRIDILLKALNSCWILNLLQCNLWTFWKKLSSGSTFYIAMGSEMPACWWSDLVVVTFDYGTDQQQSCFWLICTFFNNQGEWVLGELQTNMLQVSDFVFVFDRSTKSIRWRWDRILGLIGDGEHVVCWSFLFF
jgi:hypothetical protein